MLKQNRQSSCENKSARASSIECSDYGSSARNSVVGLLSRRLRQSKEADPAKPRQDARLSCRTSLGTSRAAKSAFKPSKDPATEVMEATYTEDIRRAVAKAIYKQRLDQDKLRLML